MSDIDALVQSKIDDIIRKYSAMPFAQETLRSSIVEMGYAFLGVSEIGTTNTGFWVDKFNKDIGLFGKAWCVAYVQYIYKYSCYIWGAPDILPNNTGSSQRLYDWAEGKDLTFTDYMLLKPADIVIWRNGRLSPFGHAGMASEIDIMNPELVGTLEGNTNSKYSRDGGDVCHHTTNILRYGDIGVPRTGKRFVRGFISFDKLFDYSGVMGAVASAHAKASMGNISGAIAGIG